MSELGPPQLQERYVVDGRSGNDWHHSRWLPIAVVLVGAAQIASVLTLPYLTTTPIDRWNNLLDEPLSPWFDLLIPIFSLACLVLGVLALAVSRWPVKIVAALVVAIPFVEVALFFRALSDMVVP